MECNTRTERCSGRGKQRECRREDETATEAARAATQLLAARWTAAVRAPVIALCARTTCVRSMAKERTRVWSQHSKYDLVVRSSPLLLLCWDSPLRRVAQSEQPRQTAHGRAESSGSFASLSCRCLWLRWLWGRPRAERPASHLQFCSLVIAIGALCASRSARCATPSRRPREGTSARQGAMPEMEGRRRERSTERGRGRLQARRAGWEGRIVGRQASSHAAPRPRRRSGAFAKALEN